MDIVRGKGGGGRVGGVGAIAFPALELLGGSLHELRKGAELLVQAQGLNSNLVRDHDNLLLVTAMAQV